MKKNIFLLYILLLAVFIFLHPLQATDNPNIFLEPRPPLSFEREMNSSASGGFVAGARRINLEAIKGLQEQNRNFYESEKFQPLNEVVIDSLKQDFRRLEGDEPAQKLRSEIKKRSRKNKLTVIDYLFYYLRYAAAHGNEKDEEKAFFQHTNVDPIYEFLPNKDNWASFNPNRITDWFHSRAIAAVDRLNGDVNISAVSTLSPVHLSCAADYKLRRLFEKTASPYVQLPLMGQGKVGVAVMVKLMLHKVHILSFSDKEEWAHSILMSRKGFPAHDLAHSILQKDAEVDSVFEHIRAVAAAYIKEGGAVQNLTETYVPYIIKKSEALNTGLLAIYEQLFENLESEDTFSKVNAQTALVGLFYRIHELYSVLPDIYLANTFTTAVETYLTIDHLINGAIRATNPLNTDREKGESPMSDEEIYKYVLENENVEKGLGVRRILNPAKIASDLVFNKSIVRSPLFIDVKIEMKDGNELKFAYPTAKYTLDSLKDEIALLKLVGLEVPLEEGESPIDQINRIYGYGQTLLGNSRIIVNGVIKKLQLNEQFSAFEAQHAPKEDLFLEKALATLRAERNK